MIMERRLWMVCYDISDTRRRKHVEQALQAFGERVQRSVFECDLDARRETDLRTALREMIDPREDKLRFYPLCDKDHALMLTWDAQGALRRRPAWTL